MLNDVNTLVARLTITLNSLLLHGSTHLTVNACSRIFLECSIVTFNVIDFD